MLGRPAVRAAAADFEMVRADGGRDDGKDQHDRQYDRRNHGERRKDEKEGEARKDGGNDRHDHASHLQASTSTLSSSDSKSARDEEENCCERPQNQKHHIEISSQSTKDP